MLASGIRLLSLLWLTSAALADDANISPTPRRPAAPPVVDLKRLEPQVAQQLASVQTLLVELTSKPGTTDKQRADAHGEFGRLLHAYGYAEEAVVCYRLATSGQPDDPHWWHLLGCAAESAGKLEDAEKALQQAQKLRGDYLATRIRLANILLQLNRRDEARRVFSEVVKIDSKQAAAFAGLWTVALEDRDYQTAVVQLKRAIQLAPAANRLQYSLAMAYRGAGDIERAREHLRLRGDIGVRPDDPWLDELPQLLRGANVHLVRGKIALAAGAVQDAIAEYRRAIDAAPDNVSAHTDLAVALVRLQKPAEAIEQLEVALRLDPRNVSALFNLASLRAGQRDFTSAATLLRTLLKIEPRDLDAHRQLAQSLVGLNRPAEAIQTLREARSFGPDDESTVLELAAVLASQQ